ncbi:hypothetical protein MP228_000640 [Amoeboaphelidium protococcarum]|nr:hypothetical protein MP228_000640 [Amoeboaphelidium protococcarum]
MVVAMPKKGSRLKQSSTASDSTDGVNDGQHVNLLDQENGNDGQSTAVNKAQDSSFNHGNSLRRREIHLSSQDIHKLVASGVTDVLPDEEDIKVKRWTEKLNLERQCCKEEGRIYVPPTFAYKDVPTFLQDNEYIRSGYRAYYTYFELWHSVLRLHNESMNIWSHLFGLCLVLYLFIQTVGGMRSEDALVGDKLAMSMFFCCAIACFLFSSLFHTHYSHSKYAFVKFGCLDYAGISTMICGSNSIITYLAFYCDAISRRVWVTLTIMVAFVGVIGPFHEKWAHRSFRKWRAIIYTLSAVTSATPCFQYLIEYGFPETLDYRAYVGIGVMTFFYLGGAFIYASRIPERWFPGKCDIFGHSHQWWHIAVICATYAHYCTACIMLDWRQNIATCDKQQ